MCCWGWCSSLKLKNNNAFKREIRAPLLSQLPAQTGRMFVVRLVSIRDLPIGSAFSSSTDSFVELRLTPTDPVGGLQKQTSSIKPATRNPKWEPPQRFQFAVSDTGQDSRVILSVYQYNMSHPRNSTPLGDAILKLKDVPTQGNPIQKSLKLISPKDGRPFGEMVVVVSSMTVADAMNIQEHCVYEYQRWTLQGWGPPSLPTDRDPWCKEDGSHFGKTINDVAPRVPPGWDVVAEWHNVGTDNDPDGWQYSSLFESPYWYDKPESYVVRRRTWHRVVRNNPNNTDTRRESVSERERKSSTASQKPKRKRFF